jgi:AcrR family transcriptional regulator
MGSPGAIVSGSAKKSSSEVSVTMHGTDDHMTPASVVGQKASRLEPSQDRSAKRIASMLDAAARIVDESGIDGVTVTAVAFHSGSSVGAVYRYFPSVSALLRALAQRNLNHFFERVEEGSEATPNIPWASLELTLGSYVQMHRTTPSFRILRFGDIITDRFLTHEESNNRVIARQFAGMLSETHGVTVDDDMVFHLEVAITLFSGLVDQAFRDVPEGDARMIEQATAMTVAYLRTNLPLVKEGRGD